MNTNSALIVPSSSTASNAAENVAFCDSVKPPVEISNPWLWVWWGLGLLIAAAAVYFFLQHQRKKAKRVSSPPPIPPHDRARRALERALSLISDPKAFTVAVSDALRVYLEERFNFHAPDRTTEEFLYELQATQLLTDAQKKSLAEFLSRCDLVKFAKYEPTETELRALHESALRLVNETEPRVISLELGSAAPASSTNPPVINAVTTQNVSVPPKEPTVSAQESTKIK